MPLELRIGMSYWRNIQLELIQPLSAAETFYSEALKAAPEQLNHQAALVREIDSTVADLKLQKFVVHSGSQRSLRTHADLAADLSARTL